MIYLLLCSNVTSCLLPSTNIVRRQKSVCIHLARMTLKYIKNLIFNIPFKGAAAEVFTVPDTDEEVGGKKKKTPKFTNSKYDR